MKGVVPFAGQYCLSMYRTLLRSPYLPCLAGVLAAALIGTAATLKPSLPEASPLPAPLMPLPAVTLCQLNKVEPAFDSRVFRDAQGKKKLERPSYIFSIGSLRDLIATRPCTDSTALLLVRYGLDPLMRLTYGVTVTCAATGGSQPFQEPIVHHMPDGGLHLRAWTGAPGATWKGTYGDVYTKVTGGANVFIKRGTGSTIYAFDPTRDTYYMTFAMNRVLAFLNDNEFNAGARSATHVELVSYAHLKVAGHYHHGVMLVARDQQGRMIDNASWPHTYAMRGLNMGTPCPDYCSTFTLLNTGPAVSGCP